MKSKLFNVFILGFFMLSGFSGMGQRTYVKNRVLKDNNLNWSGFSGGIQLGTNYFDHHRFILEKIKNQKVLHISHGLGFNIGGVIKYRFHEFLQLSLELSFLIGNKQEVSFTFDGNTKPLSVTPDMISLSDKEQEVTHRVEKLSFAPNMFSLPLLVEVGIYRLNNIRPFLASGLSLSYNIVKRYEADELIKIENPTFFNRKKLSLNYEIGLGIEFIFDKFRLSPSIRWSMLLGNIVNPSKEEGLPVKHGKHSVFTVNFGVIIF